MTERLYYEGSFLRRFDARVTDIREASRTDGVSIWQIALDRTAFYPTSGGQPCDTGSLTTSSRGGALLDATVESVEEDEHGTIWHFTRKPVTAGTEITGEINWSRRMDHMQQHTGQHLLSAVFAREMQAPTASFHLGDAVSTIDLAVGPIAHHSIERVEQIANELIAEDRAVTVKTVERAEADAMLADGRLQKLPERGGRIRLIEIADYDLNACGGTHVRSTGQIGGLLVRSVEKVSRGIRVEFVCGQRAMKTARHDFTTLSQAAAELSIARDSVPAAIGRMKQERKQAEKERQRLRSELASYHSVRLVVEEQIKGGLRLVNRSFDDRDADYVRLLAQDLTASAPRTVAVLTSEETWPARLVLAKSGDVNLHCGDLLREIAERYGLRGGGSSEVAQTDVPKEHLDGLRDELEAEVCARCRLRAGRTSSGPRAV
ncbi:MAG TPA: DHHA1 domain-containing protein [Acidobacteriaceae bacterium]|nr:DHHA1 domain-containing protein [Acidobacteriaceae bacterium]